MQEIRTRITDESAAKISYLSTMTKRSRRNLYGFLLDCLVKDLSNYDLCDLVNNSLRRHVCTRAEYDKPIDEVEA